MEIRGRITSSLQIKDVVVELDSVKEPASELIVFHPIRESFVSITTTLLQEIDARTGALLGEISYDPSLLGDKQNSFECAVACGFKYIIASISRYLVIWDLHEMVLYQIAEVATTAAMSQKSKHISAIAASTCSKGIVFFAHEGSQSIKSTTANALCAGNYAMKKIPRKVVSRNSSITALEYHSSSSILCCGASDGTIQIWHCNVGDEEIQSDPKAAEQELGHTLLSTINSKPTAVYSVVFHHKSVDVIFSVAYVSKHIEVYRVAEQASPISSSNIMLPGGYSFGKKQSIIFGPLPQSIVVSLEDSEGEAAVNLLLYGGEPRFCTPLELPTVSKGFAFVTVCADALALYISALDRRSLNYLGFADDEPLNNPTPILQLSSECQLSFGQYCSPDSLPTSILQLIYSTESSRYEVSKLSLKSNERQSIGNLPATFEHQPLRPVRLRASHDMSIASVFFTTPSTSAICIISPTTTVVYEVTDGCFTSTGFISLLSSGRGIRQHGSIDTTEPQGTILSLPVPTARIFSTRIPLPNSESCKLLFLLRDSSYDLLRLSEHTLAFTNESPTLWSSHKNERVVDVQMEPSTQQAPHHIAVLTTHRIVVLDASLVAVMAYSPSNLMFSTPTSILWIGSAISFTTSAGNLLYLPTQLTAESKLICSLPLAAGNICQIVACLPDRLLYTIQQNGQITTYVRPFSMLEIFAFSQPDLELTRAFTIREIEYNPHVQVSHALLVKLSSLDLELALALVTTLATGGSFRLTSHIATSTVCSLYLGLHRWREALIHALADDPSLQEYASNPSGSEAQLPQRLSVISSQLNHLGSIMEKFGQFQYAAQCYDVAGNDKAIFELLLKCNSDPSSTRKLVDSYRISNPPLCASLTAAQTTNVPSRLDPFRLLCTGNLVFERRSRLLAQLSLRNARLKALPSNGMPSTASNWKYFTWKRLVPEDSQEWIGSAEPHYAAEEFQMKKKAAALSIDTQRSSFDEPRAAPSIGPFLEEEDGVVAYWRFEDAATNPVIEKELQLVDTSKRENHITVSSIQFVLSTAPVDRGEENKLLPEYAMQFPSSNGPEYGGKCLVKRGSTLDIGVSFDEDPYRRSMTVECWVRYNNEDPSSLSSFSGVLLNRIVPGSTTILWSFSIDRGALNLSLLGRSIKSDSTALKPINTWQHVAGVIDITSEDKVNMRLAVDGQNVIVKEITMKMPSLDTTDVSILQIGPQLTRMEMTEIRIWATSRSEQQLADMKENYLSMAETKKRIKMKIHERDCQCEKCIGRRQNTPIAKLAMVQPLSSTPTSRDRRQRMGNKTPQTSSPMHKSQETRR